VRPSSLVRAKLPALRNPAGQVGCLPNPTREKSGGFLGLPACVHLSGLRFLRRFDLPEPFSATALANERLERGLVNVFSFVDVDRAAYVSVEARVEQTGRILQRCPLGEGPRDQNICRIHIIFRQGFYVEGVICRIRANCCPSRRTIFTFC